MHLTHRIKNNIIGSRHVCQALPTIRARGSSWTFFFLNVHEDPPMTRRSCGHLSTRLKGLQENTTGRTRCRHSDDVIHGSTSIRVVLLTSRGAAGREALGAGHLLRGIPAEPPHRLPVTWREQTNIYLII